MGDHRFIILLEEVIPHGEEGVSPFEVLQTHLHPAPAHRAQLVEDRARAPLSGVRGYAQGDAPYRGSPWAERDSPLHHPSGGMAYSVKGQHLPAKTTLVDVGNQMIQDVHLTTTRKPDAQIAPQLVGRCSEQVKVLIGDKGYDDQNLRQRPKGQGIRP